VTTEVAKRVPLKHLLKLKERNDKLLSNIFRHRIDLLLSSVQFFQCRVCLRVLTEA